MCPGPIFKVNTHHTDCMWNMCLCVAVLFTLWTPSGEAGGKDLKATQVYPGQLGLRVHTSTSHVGQSVNPLRQILPSIWGCRKIGVPMCGPQTYLFKLKKMGHPCFGTFPYIFPMQLHAL